MSTAEKSTASERLALTAAEVANRLGISQRHFWSMVAAGRVPRPFRLGRSVRWVAEELEAWLRAGAPPLDRWERIRDTFTAGTGE